ncbi:MAG: hypothetical protein MI976_01590 [Pseudomonadales bacterium]|nr:hypothetical protein [Pseudomonadales bacterium]
MKSSEEEKINLEHDAARLFMRWYEKNTGIKIRHIWHNRPQKPDVSCYLEGKRLDLEIAHLYGSEQEAMQLLGRDLSERTIKELRALALLSNPHERLLQALNRILDSKSQKSYKTARVWLVIRNVNPVWDKDEIATLQHHIDVPDEHPFEQIWMVGDMKGETGIVQLYP